MEKGWCIWVTGLPGSGKSVVSRELIKLLKRKHVSVQLLSSDQLRKVLTPKPSYSLEERNIVYSTLVYIAELLTANGVNVLIDATGNLRRYREEARDQIARFIEAYLDCPVEVCMQREAKRKKTYHAPKGIYSGAMKGKSVTVPGMGQPYEAPLHPEVVINAECPPELAAEKIMEAILSLK